MALNPHIIKQIAGMGTGGDSIVGHLTPGDLVVPAERPQVQSAVMQMMQQQGMMPQRFVAGSPYNERNPNTGMAAFEDAGDGEGGGNDSGGSTNASGTDSASAAAQAASPNGTGPGEGTTDGTNGIGGSVAGVGGTTSGSANANASAQAQAQAQGDPSDADPGGSSSSTVSAPSSNNNPGLVEQGLTAIGIGPDTAHGMSVGAQTGATVGAIAGAPGSAIGGAIGAGIGAIGANIGDNAEPGVADPTNNTQTSGAGDTYPGPSMSQRLSNQNLGPPGGVGPQDNGVTGVGATTGDPILSQMTDIQQALSAARGIGHPVFTPGSDQDIIAKILGQQQTDTENQLQNARARGTISDAGYNAAETQFPGQVSQARAKITNAADQVLADYQSRLDAITSQATQAAGQTSTSHPFDIAPWQTNYNNEVNSLQGNVEGGIRNNLPISVFDLPSLIQYASNNQGLINPGGSRP